MYGEKEREIKALCDLETVDDPYWTTYLKILIVIHADGA